MSRWGLLGRNRAYGSLWAARTLSMMGSAIIATTLVLYLGQVGVSPSGLGGVLVAQALPQTLGPLAGTLSDRVEGRRLMVICDLGQAVLVGAIALLLPPYWLLVALVAGASTLSALFSPAGKGAVPRLVARQELTRANALLGSSFNLSVAAGPALGALLVAGPGVRAALALAAASIFVSALLLLRLPPLPGHPRDGMDDAGWTRGFLSEAREGLSYLAAHRIVRAVAVGLFLSVAFAAMDNVALLFLVTDSLDANRLFVGVALSFYGTAMVAAPLVLLRLRCLAGAPALVLTCGLVLTGVGLMLAGLSPGVATLLVFYGIAGAGNGLENVACDTLIGSTVEPSKLGRVFGTVYGPIFLASTLAAVAGAALVGLASPRVAFLTAGCGVLFVLLLVRKMLPALPEEPRAA